MPGAGFFRALLPVLRLLHHRSIPAHGVEHLPEHVLRGAADALWTAPARTSVPVPVRKISTIVREIPMLSDVTTSREFRAKTQP